MDPARVRSSENRNRKRGSLRHGNWQAGAVEGQEGKGFEGHVMNSNWANLIYKWIKWNEVLLHAYVSIIWNKLSQKTMSFLKDHGNFK